MLVSGRGPLPVGVTDGLLGLFHFAVVLDENCSVRFVLGAQIK